MQRNKRKYTWVMPVCMVMYGVFFGAAVAWFMDDWGLYEADTGTMILCIIHFVIAIVGTYIVQTMIHEVGHMICGLLSGYHVCSFRIFSFAWVKKEKICFQRMSVAGTSGQCLMVPPELIDGKMPFVLYNLGGVIANLLTAVLLGIYYWYFVYDFDEAVIVCSMVITGMFLVLQNGIPFPMQMIDNDACNTVSLLRNPEAVCSFWVQLKVNEWSIKGVRLKDMPAEWFAVPCDETATDIMTTTVGVLACNRLMDEKRFEEAEQWMQHMLTSDCEMTGLQRGLVLCNCIYLEAIAANRQERLHALLTAQQKQFMRKASTNLSVMRTEYALACRENKQKADAIQTRFEAYAKKCLYLADVQSERELIEIAEQKAIGKEPEL